MSTASLPSYVSPSLAQTPLYSAEPREYEQRIALATHLHPRPSGNFVKKSRNGDAQLQLNAQDENATVPIYGSGGSVEGSVELAKASGVASVEVKIEGRLRMNEIAEGGTTSVKLCLNTALLWIKDANNVVCPTSLHFRLNIPRTFTYEGKTYPLPPTFYVKLSGLPGFTAMIDYSVSAIVNKSHVVPNLVPAVKSSLFGINIGIGSTAVSTPFVYFPRSRPALPVPSAMVLSSQGYTSNSEWRMYESTIHARSQKSQDILTKFYIPASRIYCISQPIPFYLTLESSDFSLAAFTSLSPTANQPASKRATRVQVLRQSTVDVRNAVVVGTKTEMWRTDSIGAGTFRHAGDGPHWISFSGEITLDDSVKVPGFKAGGLAVKDYILFSVSPVDTHKASFSEFRQAIPIRLTTDVWAADGTGLGAQRQHETGSEYSIPSPPGELDEYEDGPPGLPDGV